MWAFLMCRGKKGLLGPTSRAKKNRANEEDEEGREGGSGCLFGLRPSGLVVSCRRYRSEKSQLSQCSRVVKMVVHRFLAGRQRCITSLSLDSDSA